MNITQLKTYLDNLGRPLDELVAESIFPSGPILEPFPESLSIFIEPVPGLMASFWAETRAFESISVLLVEGFSEAPVYAHALPEPYSVCKSRESALKIFGEPMLSKGPFKMPIVLQDLGGWDKFALTSMGYPELAIVVDYDVQLNVTGFAFTVKETGYERDRAEAQSLIAASEPHRS